MRDKRKSIRGILQNRMNMRATFLTVMLIAPFLYAHGDTKNSLSFFQAQVTITDSLKNNTLPADTTKIVSTKKSADSLDAPVKYSAKDSTWFDLPGQRV